MATAKTDDKVMSVVEKELEKNPDASVDELYEKAKKASPSVSKLTKRQFNARYPLQVKRRKSRKGSTSSRKKAKKKAKTDRRSRKTTPKRTRRAGTAGATGTGREAVRETFMRFASDMASAEERKDLVRFLAGIDGYVDEVLKAASK